MRTGCDSRSGSLIVSLVVVAFLLAVPVVAQDCPEFVGSLPGDGWTNDLAVSGDYAYLQDASSGFRVIDVSDPSAPVQVWGLSAPVEVSGPTRPAIAPAAVAVSEGYAYLVSWWSGPGYLSSNLEVIDVSTPVAPVWMGGLSIGGWYAHDVAISGRFAYVTMGPPYPSYIGRLDVISVTWPSTPFEVGFVETPGPPTSVAVSGGYAYVACVGGGPEYEGGLRVIDVTTPALPFEVGFVDTPDFGGEHVAVENGYAYVAGSDGLRVIDVSTPSAPFEVGFLGTPMPASDVAVSGGYAYVTVGDYDNPGLLCVIDVSTPSAPVEVSCYETGGKFYSYHGGIAVSGGYVFVGNAGVPLDVFRECGSFSDGFESGDTSAWSATVP